MDLCFARVHVKVCPSRYVHPKTGTQSPQLSQLKVLRENVEFEEFWGSEGVSTRNPSWFLFFFAGFFPRHHHITQKSLQEMDLCFDRVHVKEVPSKYVHPKTGTLSPQLSQLKVLCENVEFEEFWGSERVPTPHRFLFFCRFLSQTSPHHPKIFTRNGFMLWPGPC